MTTPYEHDPEHPLTTACPFFPAEEVERLVDEFRQILRSQLSMGPRVAAFEQEFARFCGTEHAVAFPSGTSTLEAALVACGVEPGDEVLVPVQTFIATGMAVCLVGGVPVFTEVSARTFSMDFADALARCTSRTRGAIVVHFGGIIDPGLPAFVEAMHAAGRFVIEDDAHAHGAELGPRRAGAVADVGCFSFYPTKVMTTGEGGMLTTSNPTIARVARSLQNRGLELGAPTERYDLPGRNNRVTEVAAAMGLSQLRCLPGFLQQRRKLAAHYTALLSGDAALRPLDPGPGSRPAWWRYVLMPAIPVDRTALQAQLARDRISIDWSYEPPLHLQPVFRRMLSTRPGMLPRSEHLLSRHICLPIHPRLRERDAAYVVQRLRACLARIDGGKAAP